MIARVTMARSQPGSTDEFIQVVEEGFLPAAREQPGFRGFLLLTERGTGNHIGISLWDSEADAQASEGPGGYYQEQLQRLTSLQAAPPTHALYEVNVQA